jgi:hypothetical protein
MGVSRYIRAMKVLFKLICLFVRIDKSLIIVTYCNFR